MKTINLKERKSDYSNRMFWVSKHKDFIIHLHKANEENTLPIWELLVSKKDGEDIDYLREHSLSKINKIVQSKYNRTLRLVNLTKGDIQ